MALFWPILDPLSHVLFGDTAPLPPPLRVVTFFIFKIQAFSRLYKQLKMGNYCLKKSQKMSCDTLVDLPRVLFGDTVANLSPPL